MLYNLICIDFIMKTKIIALLIMVLVFFDLFLGFRIKKPDDKIVQPPAQGLPVLYVENNTIRRADNHERAQLKGVSTMAFAYEDYPISAFIGIAEKVKLWNINLLGLFIQPDIVENKTEELDEIINWAEKNYIYIYLMPRASDQMDLSNQLIRFPSMMSQLAKNYAKKNHIIYGFWAEPNMEWGEWYKLADQIAKEIVREKPDALMLLTGINFGRSFDLNRTFPYKNIILDFHDYPASDINSLQSVLAKDEIDFLWKNAKQTYPILVGEFGGVWQYGFGSREDLIYIQKLLDEINKNGLSYSAYTIDNHNNDDNDVEEGLGLINWYTGLPTKKGGLIRQDLLNYPPTDFSK